ncbi:GNAT family N-acetyltransferase [Pseudoalteromonas xiamenensis]|uniref:GNAT family N-acetyltransferase n=1 Tax=Pseudoalteromonas xiamenensis TaxID=882626 RepID=UPI0035EC7E33
MSIVLRDADFQDVEKIIDIHMVAFKGFFLADMGRMFLRLLYLAFIRSDVGVIRVAVDDGNIIGFAAGTIAPEQFFTELKKSEWLSFLLASFFGFIKNPVKTIKKLYGALFYKGDSVETLKHAALLSSIAVSPEYRGNSIGARLLEDFEECIVSMNLNDCLYLTTDKYSNDYVVMFYRNAGFSIDSEFFQSYKRPMYRFVKSLKR